MKYLTNETTGAIWVCGSTLQECIEKVGQIGNTKFDHFPVSKYECENSIGAIDPGNRWFFGVYDADGDYYAGEEAALLANGMFEGYIALVETDRAA